jgi:hypothetical protein
LESNNAFDVKEQAEEIMQWICDDIHPDCPEIVLKLLSADILGQTIMLNVMAALNFITLASWSGFPW